MHPRVLAGIAAIGVVASVLAAGLLWLMATRPETAGTMLSAWLGGGR